MNSLRNLKIFKSNNLTCKSFTNKINFNIFNTNNENNKSAFFPKYVNKKHYYPPINGIGLKSSFIKAKLCRFSEAQENDLNNKPNNQELINQENNGGINFNYIYDLETNIEEGDLNKILKQLEDPSLLAPISKKKTFNEKLEYSNLEKNMLYTAYAEINRKFPLKNKYNIESFETLIRAKLYRDMNNRREKAFYKSKFESNTNTLSENISHLFKHYQADDYNNFINSFSVYLDAVENELVFKNHGNASIEYVQELFDLSKFLKEQLYDSSAYTYHTEKLFNINNKVIIKLIDEIQVLLIDALGKINPEQKHKLARADQAVIHEFNCEFILLNENIILDIINKYKINEFEKEKYLTFNHIFNRESLLFNKSKVVFTNNFIADNLISYLTNAITVLSKQFGDNSVNVAKYYYMLSYINLKFKNFEKTEEYIEKLNAISNINKEKLKEENSKEFINNEILNVEYLYIKSQLLIAAGAEADGYALLKRASDIIENIETKYFSASLQNFLNSQDNTQSNHYISTESAFYLDQDYNFSALKFKINYNLGIHLNRRNNLLEMQSCFERCLKINSFCLKSNKLLMQQYLQLSEILLTVYTDLNLPRKIYDLSKRNFELSYYIINDKAEQSKKMTLYSENIIKFINGSYDKYNCLTLLNPKRPAFDIYKYNQECFIYSMIDYFQNEKKNFIVGKIFNEYLELVSNTNPLQAESYENCFNLLISLYRNIHPTTANFQEATRILLKLRDMLNLEEFLAKEMLRFENQKTEKINKDEASQEKKTPNDQEEQVQAQAQEEELNVRFKDVPEPPTDSEIDEIDLQKEKEDKFYYYRKTKENYKNWIDLAIAINYNIALNQIRSNEYNDAFTSIQYLIKFINKLNENKPIGSVIEHPYLLVNLNFLAAHYYLIKNQKIYSVPYLKSVNSMITKYDWGSNEKINAYLTQMVKLINSI